MSRDWPQEELQNASKAMKAAGHLGYEEFCELLDKTIFTAYCKDTDNNLLNFFGHPKSLLAIFLKVSNFFQAI